MAVTLLRLLVIILLGFSQLMFCLKAVPVTRIESLMHDKPIVDDQLLENAKLVTAEKEQITKISGKVDVELHDYPGSGANNRHTPRPYFERCVNC